MNHLQLLVEITVLVPEMPHAEADASQQRHLRQQPEEGLLHALLALLLVEGGHEGEGCHREVEWDVVLIVVILDAIEGDGRPVDVDDIGLIIHKPIVEEWNGKDGQHGDHAFEEASGDFIVLQSPRHDAHEQGCHEGVESYERIEQSCGKDDERPAESFG